MYLKTALTLGRLQHSGHSADPPSLSGAQTRVPTRRRAASWPADDVLSALSRRADELESLVKLLQADLDTARRRLEAYSEIDQPMQEALADTYRGANAIGQRAGRKADSRLEHAVDERRVRLRDIERSSSERDHRTKTMSARRGGIVSLPLMSGARREPSVRDHRAPLVTEMRVMLRALLEETFGPRPSADAPAPTAPPRTLLRAPAATPHRQPATTETSRSVRASPRAIVQPLVSDVRPIAAARLPSEISSPTSAAADAAAAVVASTAAPFKPEPVDKATREPDEEPRAILGALGRAEMAPSGDLFAANEPTARAVSGQAVEAVEAVDAVEVLEHVELAQAPLPDLLTGARAELTEERAIDAATQSVADGSDALVTELHVSAIPETASAVHEVIVEAWPPPAPEQEAALSPTPASADPIAQFHDLAVAATSPSAEIVSPPAPALVSPIETAAEPALTVSPPAETKGPSFVAPPPLPQNASATPPDPAVTTRRAVRQLQLVLSPVDSFPELLEIQSRIASLSSVHALQLRDFRNGVATFVAGVADALNGREFGALVQMFAPLRLRLEAATEDSVELRVEPAS